MYQLRVLSKIRISSNMGQQLNKAPPGWVLASVTVTLSSSPRSQSPSVLYSVISLAFTSCLDLGMGLPGSKNKISKQTLMNPNSFVTKGCMRFHFGLQSIDANDTDKTRANAGTGQSSGPKCYNLMANISGHFSDKIQEISADRSLVT